MPPAADIAAAVDALRSGRLIGLPTETVYGLGADARNPDAVRRVFDVKGRPSTHPLIVHVGDATQLDQWAMDVPDAARALATRFWPGPLTLVLPRAADVLDEVTGGQDTIALRVPGHPVALALLRAFGSGIAAPSANRYGRISPTTAEAVREELGDAVAVVLDGGPCEVGLESTIVACLDGQVRVLRPGHITREDVERATGPVTVHADTAPRVPGSARSHYAPSTVVDLVSADDLPPAVRDHLRAGRRIAVLAMRERPAAVSAYDLRDDGVRWIVAEADAYAYGRGLYARLRELDRVGADRLVIERPPAGAAWTAVHDRLRRAAGSIADDAPARTPESTAP